MNKKKLLIATGLLTGTVIGVGVGVGIALSSSKNTGNPEEAKKELSKEIQTSKSFENELISPQYSTIKGEYLSLVSQYKKLLEKEGVTFKELSEGLKTFKTKLESLKQRKTQEDTAKAKSINDLTNLLKESKDFANSLTNEKYSEIKTKLTDAITLAQVEFNNKDSKSASELNTAVNNLKNILTKAKNDYEAMQDEQTRKMNSETALKNKIDEATTFLSELGDTEKYQEIKNELSQAKTTADSVYAERNSKTIEELKQVLNQLNDSLTAAKTKKSSTTNANANFTAETPTKEDVTDNTKYKFVVLNLTSNILLDSLSDIQGLIVNNEPYQLSSVEYKANSTNKKEFTLKFPVGKNGTYSISAVKILGVEQNKTFSPVSINITDFPNNSISSFEANTDQNNTKPTLESINVPLSEYKDGLSEVFQENQILDLQELEYYLYLINGERVSKYLPKKIRYEGKVYKLGDENKNDISTFTGTNGTTNSSSSSSNQNQQVEKPTQYVPKTFVDYFGSQGTNQTVSMTASSKPEKNKEKEINYIYVLDNDSSSETDAQPSETNTTDKTVKFIVKFAEYDHEQFTKLTNMHLEPIQEKSNNFTIRNNNYTNNQIDKLVNGIVHNDDRWTNWNDRFTDQSSLLNEFVFKVKDNNIALINGVVVNIRTTALVRNENNSKAGGLGGLVIPENIRILVSEDGENFIPVKHQDKVNHKDFGESSSTTTTNTNENNNYNNKQLQKYFVTRSASVLAVTISFEPTFAKYIKFQWDPRAKDDSATQKEHYSWEISEIEFQDLNNKDLDALKKEYITKTKQQDKIIEKLTKLIEYYADLTDTNSKRYSFIKLQANDLKDELNAQKDYLKILDAEKFKNKINEFINKTKTFDIGINQANNQNPTSDIELENALLQSRELINNLYPYLAITKSHSNSMYYETILRMIEELLSLNESTSKTADKLFNVVYSTLINFDKFKKEFEQITNTTTLARVDEETIQVKQKQGSVNAYEASMDLIIYNIKNNENANLKLKLNPESTEVVVSEVQYSDWSNNQSPSTSSSQDQPVTSDQSISGSTESAPTTTSATETGDSSENTDNQSSSSATTQVTTENKPKRKRITFTITNNSNAPKTVSFNEIWLGDTKLTELSNNVELTIPNNPTVQTGQVS
ncbi:hypothetical protein [Mycoplasmopsis felis]|uniref:hypothetical protein n=1 Tax=Mycoplasmopsis felis TaxID=33923 RepID=UPI002DD42402|nr:hypothetical protein [Mycoplasmopsis felis]WRX06456.1 hypothetical protein O7984_02880 [Mycoplasmopsis felis]